MKKIKLLPLLLALPLLASCGLAKPSKGGFARVSDADKISAKKFLDAITKEQNKVDFMSEKALPSSESKIETRYALKADLKRGKKVLRAQEDIENQTDSLKYDKANQILALESKGKEIRNFSLEDSNFNESYENKNSSQYQFSKVGKYKHLLSIDNTKKEYWSRKKIAASDKPAEIADEYAKGIIADFASGTRGFTLSELIGMYMSSTEKEQKDYTFYKKDRVYTVEYNFEEADKEIKNSEKVVAKQTVKMFFKAQVVFEDGKNKEVHYSTQETTYTAVKNHLNSDSYGSYVMAKDDVLNVKWEASELITYARKDMKLKAIDISKYTQMGSGWED